MQVDTPHPSYTGSTRARAAFRLAVRIALAFVALLWAVQLLNWGLGLDVAPFGVKPRTVAGLAGLLSAPLVHSGFDHLIANTLPLAVLGVAMLHLYPRSSPIVLPAIWIGPGIVVWLFARGGIHVGASGLVYGLVAYVFAAGLIRRDRRAIAASMVVAFMYGASVWGVLPIQRDHSWETHLAAALIGLVLAVLLRRRDIPPRVRYDWEDGDEVIDLTPRMRNRRAACRAFRCRETNLTPFPARDCASRMQYRAARRDQRSTSCRGDPGVDAAGQRPPRLKPC
jgi:MYXO-CTERM domain-containing protein